MAKLGGGWSERVTFGIAALTPVRGAPALAGS